MLTLCWGAYKVVEIIGVYSVRSITLCAGHTEKGIRAFAQLHSAFQAEITFDIPHKTPYILL